MNYRFLLWLLLVLSAARHSEAQQYLRYPFERILKTGDNMEWVDPELDPPDWVNYLPPDSLGNMWVRFKVNCDSITDAFTVPGMQIISYGSYELYWDGVLIKKSGKVGKSKEEEVPGPFLSQAVVPDSLLAHGEHSVVFRVSNHHALPIGLGSWNTFYLEEYRESMRRDLILTAKNFILAGVYLMAALYSLFLYLLRKREAEGLIFSIMCFLFFGLIVLEYVKFLFPYPYHLHLYRVFFVYLLTFFISFLTTYFFIRYFKLPRQRTLLGALLLGLILISVFSLPGTDRASQFLSLAMWCSSLGIVGYAFFKRKKESGLILLAILISGAVVFFNTIPFYRALMFSYDVTLFIGFSILVLSMMYLLAKRAREQKQAYEASLLLSSRLQNELLKKNIQPHFIMNTLTSLMGWIEESPKESVHFIEALSREFEIMSDIAEKKLIPIGQEIELCKHHIEIMKYRKEVDFLFECKNIQPDEKIPPAIFHTIIENGITHSIPDGKNQIRMVLSFEKKNEKRCYQLATFAQNRTLSNNKEGTGFKYIKSRLTENYGDQWKLESQAVEHGWVTTITLY